MRDHVKENNGWRLSGVGVLIDWGEKVGIVIRKGSGDEETKEMIGRLIKRGGSMGIGAGKGSAEKKETEVVWERKGGGGEKRH